MSDERHMHRDPFKIDGPTCVSFSGGRSSAYMLWRVLQSNGGELPTGCVAVFANTGKEDEGTLEFVRDCANYWDIDIQWIEYCVDNKFKKTDFAHASRKGEPFAALIAKKQFLPNAVMRFCTSDLKIKPIAALLESMGLDDVDMVVGIRADEPRRIAKMGHLHLPLAIAGIAKANVMEFWAKQPFDLDTEAGNCDLCFNKGVSEIMSLVQLKPARAVWWAAQEEKVGARFAKDRPTYAQMKRYAEDQSQLFPEQQEAVSCFCGD